MLYGGLPRLPMKVGRLLLLNPCLRLWVLLDLLPPVTLVFIVGLVGPRSALVFVHNIRLMVRHFQLHDVD